MSARLDRDYRDAALRELDGADFDVLVIGGGVVGTGAALDAASRGLSVALVEARDWAAGTSSRSSKLIHGGLRYLQQRDFALVREALRERRLMLRRLAPHLVHPVPFIYPLRHRVWERAYVGAGVLLYDTIGGARALPWHRHLTRRRVLELAPSLRPDALTGAVRYYDAQVDDARHTLALARTAAQHGATVLNRAEVTTLLRHGPRITGARVRDLETGREYAVGARRVISATGVWTDEIQRLAGVVGRFRVRSSKGVHLVIPRDRLELATGMIMRTERSVLLAIPWGRHWIIGTTDTAYDMDKEHPTASRADIQYLLDHINPVLRNPLSIDDIESVYAGLRPLLAGKASETAQLSRTHAVSESAPGLFVIAGGKYTTYRVMAADVVDAASGGLGREVAPSLTDRLPLLGAVGFRELWRNRHQLARRTRLPMSTVEHLLGRYGSAATDLFAMIRDSPQLADPIPGAEQHLKVEAVYAVTHEGALHLEDVLSRRMRISIENRDGGRAAARHVADLIAPWLGWDSAVRDAEVERFGENISSERAARAATEVTTG